MSDVQLKNPTRSLYILFAGVFIMMVVVTVNTPAYPAIMADLKFEAVYITWINVFYALAAAVLAPVMGRFGDLAGLKKALVAGLIVFAIGTLLLAIAPALPVYLGGRFAQGLGVACAMPACMTFIGRFFPPDKIAKNFTIFGACCTAGPIFGPLIASAFLSADFLGWRLMYATGAALAGLVGIIVIFVLPKIPAVVQEKTKFDVSGAVCMFIAVGSFLLSPTLASLNGWTSPIVIGLLALFLVFGIAFIVLETKKANPLVNLKFVKSKNFSIPIVIYMVFSAMLQAFMYMLSYVVVLGMGHPAAMTGTIFSFMYIIMTASAVLVGKLMAKVNWRTVAFIPIILNIAGCVTFMLTNAQSPIWMVFLACGFLGVANAFNTPLFTTSAMAKVPDESARGSASGTFRMLGDLGGPIGVAVFIPMLTGLALRPDGVMDYSAAFPQVAMTMGIVIALCLILAFFYPRHDPKEDAEAGAASAE
ncbi:MFS transporter [Eggerthella timonensis]|uniref:MFS transporter n=1 Tax=Eggerthella timonensis TaxID=1871008 RepID=UPI000C793AD4|nr:MFS transporter [Eggerthella timonensis]